MALNATIYKFTIDISDLDRNIYDQASVHVALHPSETLERMTMRLLAYCLNYTEQLTFTKGLSTDNEPDLWEKNYSDEIECWIELGLPDDKRIKKASSQSKQVILYPYGGQNVDKWWQTLAPHLHQFPKVSVYQFDENSVANFAEQIERTMAISCVIQDGQLSLSWDSQMMEFAVSTLHRVE